MLWFVVQYVSLKYGSSTVFYSLYLFIYAFFIEGNKL